MTLDPSKNGAPDEPGYGIKSREYTVIEAGVGSFEETSEERGSAGVTSPTAAFFEDCATAQTDDELVIGQLGGNSHSGSR